MDVYRDIDRDPQRHAERMLFEARPHFENRWSCYERAFRYYRGDQWTPEEIRAFHSQFRHHYVFNEIATKVDHLLGVQRRTRTEPVVRSRRPERAAEADEMTARLAVISDLSDAEYVESDVFLDSLLAGYGVAAVRTGTEPGMPIKIERISPYEILWDVTATDRALAGARWLARSSILPRRKAAEQFPEYSKLIERAGANDFGDLPGILSQRRMWRATRSNEVRITEFYERRKVHTWHVVDEASGAREVFGTRAAALDWLEGLTTGTALSGGEMFTADGRSRYHIQAGTRNAIYQTLIIGGHTALHQETALPDFPYVVSFCHYHDGDFWAFVDQLIDPQIFVNRYLTQWDYQLGTSIRNAVTVMESLLRRGWRAEDVRRELSKTAPVLPVLSHGAIDTLQGKSPDPALFQGIDMAMSRMVDYSGGRNYLGLTENAAESGRAVAERVNASSIGRLPLWDNLRLFRRRLFTLALWHTMYLEGDPPESLEEMELSISLEEVASTDSQREREFTQMKELFQSVGGIAPEIILSTMIELSSLPQSRKERLLAGISFYQEFAARRAAEEEDAKLQASVQKSLKRSDLKEHMETAQQTTHPQTVNNGYSIGTPGLVQSLMAA